MDHFANTLQHILAELERIDLLIHMQFWHARQLQGQMDELQGFYISEEEIERVLARPIGLPRWAAAPLSGSLAEAQTALEQLKSTIAQHKAASSKRGINLRLETLAQLFQLDPFEVDVLLICLAPELDLRYERIYAYLQDDVTRKRPSVDLVLNLLSPSFSAKLNDRHRFLPAAALFHHQLLHLLADPAQQDPPLLSKYLKVDERIVNFLLDNDDLDIQLRPYAKFLAPEVQMDDLLLPLRFKQRLGHLLAQHEDTTGLVFYFLANYGYGKQSTALALCAEVGQGLLLVNGLNLLTLDEPVFTTAVTRIMREARLQNAALYWQGFDYYLSESNQARLDVVIQAIESRPGLTILAGNTVWEPANALKDKPFVRITFPQFDHAARQKMWAQAMNGRFPQAAALEIGELANKFRFSGGQIQDAAVTAANLARWRDPEHGQVTMADLYAASRLQSNRNLSKLAQKITPHYVWEDIVLPPDRLEQLREICNQVTYRARVYEEWGFNQKLSLGKGVNALFAGPSGTGKTMAADIIAGELGLELYKIDLSTVVSKYIGETEKNLSRIFDEAETSNAILFFDEADALFGKRNRGA